VLVLSHNEYVYGEAASLSLIQRGHSPTLNPLYAKAQEPHLVRFRAAAAGKQVVLLTTDRMDTAELLAEAIGFVPRWTISECDFPTTIQSLRYHPLRALATQPAAKDLDFVYWGTTKRRAPSGERSDSRFSLLRDVLSDRDLATYLSGTTFGKRKADEPFETDLRKRIGALERGRATACFQWPGHGAFLTARYHEACALGVVPFCHSSYDTGDRLCIDRWQRFDDARELVEKVRALRDPSTFEKRMNAIRESYESRRPDDADQHRAFSQALAAILQEIRPMSAPEETSPPTDLPVALYADHEDVAVASLLAWFADYNPRGITESELSELEWSLGEYGLVQPIVVNRRSEARGWAAGTAPCVVGGHQRVRAADRMKLGALTARWVDLDEPQERRLNLLLNHPYGHFDDGLLADDLKYLRNVLGEPLEHLGLGADELDRLLALDAGAPALSPTEAKRRLHERFGVPPFSVLDTRQGYWLARKQAWLALGIKSEIGRAANLLGFSETVLSGGATRQFGGVPDDPEGRIPGYYTKRDAGMAHEQIVAEFVASGRNFDGTSVFDPVLCELAYRWFCPPGGLVVDPFAGGSVRGVVAAYLGRRYFGVELRSEQVEANVEQAVALLAESDRPRPTWVCGDARAELPKLDAESADLVFTCPPYFDLERYSDDPCDLSNMPWNDFCEAYGAIIVASARLLRPDRFACVVVSDVRAVKGRVFGCYRGLVRRTIDLFEHAGLGFYNDAVLIQPAGSATIRVARTFQPTRKLCRTHQNVLVFAKGDPRKAAEAIGEVDFGAPEPAATALPAAMADGLGGEA